MLSIDEKHVLVEAQEHGMHELLDKHGFTPIPVPLRSIAEFGGAFHCCTTDVRRAGELKSYFPHIDQLEARGEVCQFAPYGADAPDAYKPQVAAAPVSFAVPHAPRAQEAVQEAH